MVELAWSSRMLDTELPWICIFNFSKLMINFFFTIFFFTQYPAKPVKLTVPFSIFHRISLERR